MPLKVSLAALWLRVSVGWGTALGLRRWVRLRVGHAVAADPMDAYALATLAHLHAECGEFNGARAALRRCVTLQPEIARHWFNLGFACECLGQLNEAEAAFRRATELEPKLDRAWYGLGLALIAQDRLAEAAPALHINTQLQPMSPHGWYQLARVHFDLGAIEEARRVIHRLRQFEPKVAAQLERETGLGT